MHRDNAAGGALFPNAGQAVLLVIGMLVVQFGVGMAIGFSALIGDSPASGPKFLLNPWVLSMVNIVAIGTALFIGLRATREVPTRFFAVKRFHPSFLLPILLTALGMAVVMDSIARVFIEVMRSFPQRAVEDVSEELMSAHPLGGFVLVVIIAPISEEYLFRGMILRGLLARHGTFFAVLFSAILFGVMHANLLQLQVGLALGSVFGWWMSRTHSVGPGLIGHAVYNAVAYFSTVFPDHVLSLGSEDSPGALRQIPWLVPSSLALVALGIGWFKERADSLTQSGALSAKPDPVSMRPAETLPPIATPPVIHEPHLPAGSPAVDELTAIDPPPVLDPANEGPRIEDSGPPPEIPPELEAPGAQAAPEMPPLLEPPVLPPAPDYGRE